MIVLATLALTAALYLWAHTLRRSLRNINAHRDTADITRIEEGLIESEPEPWPVRQTPTDLAAAYEPAPVVERQVSWVMPDDAEFEAHLVALRADYAASIRAFRWATGELERIRVDVRDGVLTDA